MPMPAQRCRYGWSLAAACALLLACSPRYDWRTVRSTEGAYVADYPAKPGIDARAVWINGQHLPMTMQAARVDGALFAVGAVTLPANDPLWRQRAVAALRAGLSRNLRGHVTVRDLVVRTTAKPPIALPAIELRAQGAAGAGSAPRCLTARIVAAGRHAYQAVVLESGEAARDVCQPERVDQFLASFHPD